MIEKGILPEGHPAHPDQSAAGEASRIPATRCVPGTTLNADEKKLFSRLAEVYAGFSEYTDAQVGRIIDYLEKTGQLENTIVIYAADNGASGEGSPNGSVNENKFFNGYPDELEENMKLIDELGGPNTYEHYPTGWAVAFSTPFKMFKRYSLRRRHLRSAGHFLAEGHQGQGRGAQPVPPLHRHRADDPRLLRAGVPDDAQRASSRSRCRASRCATASTTPTRRRRRSIQYYAMLGTRGIWQDGWKAVAVHGPDSGKGHFDKDVWELYHVDADRSESQEPRPRRTRRSSSS